MKNKMRRGKAVISVFLVWSFLIGCLPASGQDLIAVSDITGGSSVFVFRTSRKAPPKKFVTTVRAARTKAQRVETVKRVSRQFTLVAKAAPRRTREKTVEPVKLGEIARMKPAEAARVFAGVGEYYIDKDEVDKALEFFRESEMLDAKNNNTRNGLSEALAMKGNRFLTEEKPAKAKTSFEEAIKYNPKNAVAYYGLGDVFEELDQKDDALANYEKALALDKDLTEIYVPLGILYYQKGEIAKADEFLGKALKTSPADAQTQYFNGLIRYSQNRNEEALAAFKEAAKVDQASAESHYYTGKALMRLNRTDEAIAEFEEAVKIKPKYFEALFDAGAAYYETEKYPQAIAKYKEAAKVKNDSFETYANLGDANRQVRNFKEAEGNYDLAAVLLQRDKNFSREEAAQLYSYAGYVVGRECENNIKNYTPCRWSTTIKNLEKAVELSPNAADYTNLGWAYYNAGKIDIVQKREAEGKAKLEQAKTALQKAIALNPAFLEAPLLNLGVALIDLEDYAGAIKALKTVTEKRPEWNFGNYALGVAYRKSGDINNSVRQFRAAVEKEPNYVAALSALGESEFRNKNQKETEKIIARLKKLNAVNEAKKLEILLKGFNFGY